MPESTSPPRFWTVPAPVPPELAVMGAQEEDTVGIDEYGVVLVHRPEGAAADIAYRYLSSLPWPDSADDMRHLRIVR